MLTALASHALGGARVLRVEDLDPPRIVAGSTERIGEDLAWLGLTYDQGPLMQSARVSAYRDAVQQLAMRGLVYPCDCSRRELAAIASAPHAGDELRYPGLCRDKDPSRSFKRAPALRLRVADGAQVRFIDQLTGTEVSQRIDREVGDFVLRRGDEVYAYQLAVAVDDSAMGISHVVRGRDLLGSTARQLFLLECLERPAPSYYLHVPLVVTPDGERMAKRVRSVTIRALRDAGIGAETICGVVGHALGLRDDDSPCPASALHLAPDEAPRRLRRSSFVLPSAWAVHGAEPSAK